jgi:hypothetical protein
VCWLLRSDPVIFGVVALTLLVGIAYEVARDRTRDVIGGCAVQWCNGKVIFVAVSPEGVDTLRGF